MSNEKIPNIIPSEFILQTEHKIYVDLDYYAERTQELQRQVDNCFKTLKIIEKENDRLQKHNELLENTNTHLQKPVESDAIAFYKWFTAYDNHWVNHDINRNHNLKTDEWCSDNELYEQFKQLKK